MPITACNNFVWIERDETKKEIDGLFIPTQAQVKPHEGEILSVGELTQDKKIRKGKKALWPQTAGMTIEYEGKEYLVIESEKILGIDDTR